MSYTLWSKGQLLGSVPDLPLPAVPAAHAPGGTIVGFFHPAPAFEATAAPLLALADHMSVSLGAIGAALPNPSEMAGMSKPDQARRIQASLRSSPEVQHLVELQRAVADLALELRDQAGTVLPTQTVSVQRIPEVMLAASREEESIAADMTRAELMLVAVPPLLGTSAA